MEMDFGSLLYAAQKNEQKLKEAPSKFYKAKFDPPKKEEKKQKKLSAGIQKFLARKEEEERRKLEEAKRKKDKLLELRSQDKKSVKRVQSMLKRTKSANKAVIDDAKDDVNTAVTAAGPVQCDEDDYGYVSMEAASAYNKLMEKYSQMPPEEPKFAKKLLSSSKDLSSTRDRVKAQLLREEEEKYLPHKRRRKDKDKENGNENASDDEGVEDKNRDDNSNESCGKVPEREKQMEKEKPKKPRKPMPPPMDFHQLLKIAEEKQHQPVVVKKEAPVEKKRQEPERLMTKKEKLEYEQERERRLRRDQQMAEMSKRKDALAQKQSSSDKYPSPKTSRIESEENLPAEERLKKSAKVWSSPSNLTSDKNSNLARKKVMDRECEILRARNSSASKKFEHYDNDKKMNSFKNSPKTFVPSSSSNPLKRELSFGRSEEKSSSILKSTLERPMPDPSKSDKSKISSSKDVKFKSTSQDKHDKEFSSKDIKPREFPPKDMKSREYPPKHIKPREFPPKDIKPREFPPKDVQRKELSLKDTRGREFPPRDLKPIKSSSDDSRGRPTQFKKKPLKVVKRRIESDDEDEYDSELDDFIDDDDYDDPNEVSKAISQIFNYDKSKYRHLNDEDDAAMESNFHQVEREEFRSLKIGMMEDLEDMQREREEEERKKKRRQQKLTEMKLLKKRR